MVPLKGRLTSLTGRAVALDALKQASRAEINRETPDAYEKAITTAGGHEARRRHIPSYTESKLSPEEIAAQDVFEPERGGRERQRKIEEEQRAALESFMPEEIETEDKGVGQRELEAESAATTPPDTRRQASLSPQEISRVLGIQRARNEGLLSKFKKDVGQELAQKSQGGSAQSNIEGMRRLKRTYDTLKVGAGVTFIGLVVTLAVMNLQMIAKILDLKGVPKQSLVEDLLTIWIDINLLLGFFLTLLPLLIVVAILIGGGIWLFA